MLMNGIDNRGEQTASMLENQLSALELKIDALLASAESEPTFSQDNQNETQGSEVSKAAEKK